ncbi:MAG TPA: SulP family inorganic anion transporter [Vicinamibacterales bacterium]|nr:SulP family inorganic anion transporter [Vicinamibacterales bacterium]
MPPVSPWLPKSILALRDYNLDTFRHDLIAGITVGLVALPLGMAFATASGLPPQSGIYCAIVTGFIISALGGSRTQIGGPTGAFVVVVAGIIAQHGIAGLFMCTMMAGVLLILLGVTGTGSAVKFIPRPVIIGFTNGIAILIASTQIREFLGVSVTENTGEFLDRMAAVWRHIGTSSSASVAVGTGALATILLVNRLVRVVPGTVVALVLGTIAAWALQLPVETIGSRFGALPSGLPPFHVPTFDPALITKLISPAVTVAMLGAIESLMSAVVADRMSGDRHNPNVELIAQGVANVISPMVGGLPATGAIARTATNIRSGARTPVAGMIHALTLLMVLLTGAQLAGMVPMAVLAAILFVVAWNMGEWHEVPSLLRQSKADMAVWAATFLLTVLADLTVAVEVGMVLAALLFIRRVSHTTTVSRVTDDYVDEGRVHVLQDKPIPPYVAIFRVHGPFLFGATEKIMGVIDRIDELPPVVIFRLRNMTAIDATGIRALEEVATHLHDSGRTAVFCGALEQPRALLRSSRFPEHVGEENFVPHVDAALNRAREIYGATGEVKRPESVSRRAAP